MGMKFPTAGRLWPSLLTVVAAIGGIILTLALRELPVSVAYPIWTAIGSLGTVFLGVPLLGESLTAVAGFCGLIVAGWPVNSDAAFGLQSARFRSFESSHADHRRCPTTHLRTW